MTKFVLYLEAVEGKDVPKMDVIGKCDPFLVFNLASKPSETWKTKDITQTFEPKWNQIFKIPIISDADTLHAELFDKDKFTENDLISTYDIKLKDLPFGKVKDDWFYFNPHKGVKKGGQIHLKLHFANHTDAPFQEK